ncbi:MAG: SDR family oxidoreductase [Bacteroidales bacterium]|nr:SDR family oxidoreductase [Bacteroidales bacterium]
MKKIILITGVSSGFGKQISRLLVRTGYKVYRTVRKKTSPGSTENLLQMDLTDAESIRDTVATVVQKEGRIDILINNAGMHTGGPIETTSTSTIRLQIETNFIGMVNLTRQVLPVMRKQGGGTIINFSSIGGLMGLPYQAYYSASKFAIEGFSEALRMEVKNFNIKVIVINPGDFHTNNTLNRRKFLPPSGENDPYHDQFQKTLTIIENDENNGWLPQLLAIKIVRILKSKNPRQRYIIAPFEQKLAVVLKYILPGKLFRRILEIHYKIK